MIDFSQVVDGCTAWIFSNWLNSNPIVYQCCVEHDLTLGMSDQWEVFNSGNGAFVQCLWQVNPLLAIVAGAVVGSVFGAWYFKHSGKLNVQNKH